MELITGFNSNNYLPISITWRKEEQHELSIKRVDTTNACPSNNQ